MSIIGFIPNPETAAAVVAWVRARQIETVVAGHVHLLVNNSHEDHS
jgi:hypothetical protein